MFGREGDDEYQSREGREAEGREDDDDDADDDDDDADDDDDDDRPPARTGRKRYFRDD